MTETIKKELEELTQNECHYKKVIEPKCFFIKENKKTHFEISEYLTNDLQKDVLNSIIQAYVKGEETQICAMVSEMWMTFVKVSDFSEAQEKINEKMNEYGRIRNMPDRIECVLLTIWTDQKTIGIIWKIDRTIDPPTLNLYHETEHDINMEGTIHTILKNPFLNP